MRLGSEMHCGFVLFVLKLLVLGMFATGSRCLLFSPVNPANCSLLCNMVYHSFSSVFLFFDIFSTIKHFFFNLLLHY